MDPITIALGLSKIVPMVTRWVAGDKAGDAAEEVVKVAKSITGVTNDKDILHKIEADPVLAADLQKALLANAEKMDAMFLADRADARDREIQIVRTTGKREYNLYILAWTVVVGFFVLTGILAFKALPEGSTDAVFMLFGSLSTGFATVLSYFFGTSKSSSDKTSLLARK